MPGQIVAPIRVALLGAGIFAREEHLGALLKSKAFELKAVYSRSHKSAAALVADIEAAKNVELYSDESTVNTLDALLARDDIDAVDIVLPIHIQPALIRRAWAAGKHVISEKPIAPSLEQAEELIADYLALPEPRPLFAVAEQFRFFPAWDRVCEEAKALGNLHLFSFELFTHAHTGDKFFDTPWRQTPAFPGFLIDGGVHFAAGLRSVVNSPPKKVAAFTRQIRSYLSPVDTFNSSVVLEDGTTGTFNLSFASDHFKLELLLVGENGSVTFSGLESGVVKNTKGEVVKEFSFKGVASTGVADELEAFARGVRDGACEPKGSYEEAMKDLTLIERILQSGRAGGAPLEI